MFDITNLGFVTHQNLTGEFRIRVNVKPLSGYPLIDTYAFYLCFFFLYLFLVFPKKENAEKKKENVER